MRLFIAINFDKDVKRDIQTIIDKVKGYAQKGNFVSKEHMHLTLEFLGEIPEERVVDIKEAMKELNMSPFSFSLSQLGLFNRREGDIYWLGITENKELSDVQKTLHNLLKEKEFKLEEREYTPHLTIGRKVKMENVFNPEDFKQAINQILISVGSIDLMKSENINGKLTYTKIYSKDLK